MFRLLTLEILKDKSEARIPKSEKVCVAYAIDSMKERYRGNLAHFASTQECETNERIPYSLIPKVEKD